MSALHESDRLPEADDPLSGLERLRPEIGDYFGESYACMTEYDDGEYVALTEVQDLIDRGVLAVVKTAHSTGVRTSDFLCSECRGWTPMTLSPKFCMHCSAKIHNP